MSAAALLDRLEGVHTCREGRWRACCPVCGGRRAALSVTERDGVVLLKCFRSDCTAADITGAVGLELSDLFPPREIESRDRRGRRAQHARRPRHSCAQLADALMLETLEVLIIVGAIMRRGSVTSTEYARLKLTVSRMGVAHGEIRHV